MITAKPGRHRPCLRAERASEDHQLCVVLCSIGHICLDAASRCTVLDIRRYPSLLDHALSEARPAVASAPMMLGQKTIDVMSDKVDMAAADAATR